MSEKLTVFSKHISILGPRLTHLLNSDKVIKSSIIKDELLTRKNDLEEYEEEAVYAKYLAEGFPSCCKKVMNSRYRFLSLNCIEPLVYAVSIS